MYLVDTNVLIEARNRYYAFDISPGFWTWLDQAHQQSLACSIEAVRDELLGGNDELADWALANTAFFQPIDQGTTRHFGALTSSATSPRTVDECLERDGRRRRSAGRRPLGGGRPTGVRRGARR